MSSLLTLESVLTLSTHFPIVSLRFHRRSLFSLYWIKFSPPFSHTKMMKKRIAHNQRGAKIISKVLNDTQKVEVRKQLSQLLETEIKYSDLKYLHEIGHGGHGVVFAASYRNQIVAVKQLIPKNLTSSNAMKFIGEMQFGVMVRVGESLIKTYSISRPYNMLSSSLARRS